MQTYVVKFKSFKSVIRPSALEKIPKINKHRGTFIPDSRVLEKRLNPRLWMSLPLDRLAIPEPPCTPRTAVLRRQTKKKEV